MGGVMSASSVAFYRSEGRTVEDVSRALFRASVMGGLTLCAVNCLSAWSCVVGAEMLMAAEVKNMQGMQCLSGFCYQDNVRWAVLAVITAVVGALAAVMRNRALGMGYMLMFAGRGLACLAVLGNAIIDGDSCSAWALSKTYWMPIVTLVCVACFGGLGWKFWRVLRVLGTFPGRELAIAGEGGFEKIGDLDHFGIEDDEEDRVEKDH